MWAVGESIGKNRLDLRANKESNMRPVTLLLAGTAIALGLGASALAETGPGAKTPGERFRTQFFERLDANKDGKITKAEFDAARAAEFKAADKNGDGFISKE